MDAGVLCGFGLVLGDLGAVNRNGAAIKHVAGGAAMGTPITDEAVATPQPHDLRLAVCRRAAAGAAARTGDIGDVALV
jgi:hypothetical protein